MVPRCSQGGIGYWNEDRPTFSNDVDALCPFSDCQYSELIDDYSLIGWMQDVNGSGELDILWDGIQHCIILVHQVCTQMLLMT
ncbi:MAG: hypothetical protein R2764_16145 [Bacteroidales bacterium]